MNIWLVSIFLLVAVPGNTNVYAWEWGGGDSLSSEECNSSDLPSVCMNKVIKKMDQILKAIKEDQK